MPFIPLLTVLLPSLIKVAENTFGGSDDTKSVGKQKKTFVIQILEQAYDKLDPSIPDFITKEFFVGMCSLLIDALVPHLTKKPEAVNAG